jgi:aromatic-L-amino-acid/L-tryptophan decarboxylase
MLKKEASRPASQQGGPRSGSGRLIRASCGSTVAAVFANPVPPAFDAFALADSIAVDPHKWFFMPIVAGLLLHRHVATASAAFAERASYIPLTQNLEPWQTGIPTSRRAAGFMIWLTIRAHGWNAIQKAVHRNIVLTRLLEHYLAKGGFRILEGDTLSVACARLEPRGWTPRRCDRLQIQIAERIVASRKAWFATVRHAHRSWLRFNFLNLHTTEKHIRCLADMVIRTAAKECALLSHRKTLGKKSNRVRRAPK